LWYRLVPLLIPKEYSWSSLIDLLKSPILIFLAVTFSRGEEEKYDDR
jgi:hypothetical protein